MDALETTADEEAVEDDFMVTLNGRTVPTARVQETNPVESPKPVQSPTQPAASVKPSIASLLDVLDDVQFSDNEEDVEDEYLVVQPYESEISMEMPIAPSKDDIEFEVDGDYTYGVASDGELISD